MVSQRRFVSFVSAICLKKALPRFLSSNLRKTFKNSVVDKYRWRFRSPFFEAISNS